MSAYDKLNGLDIIANVRKSKQSYQEKEIKKSIAK